MTPVLHLRRALAAPFLIIDRTIQRAVDAGAFALMRRGVSKGAIRYVVTVAYAASLVVQIAAGFPYYAHHLAPLVVNFLFAGWWSYVANHNAQEDKRAEARGMLTAADVHRGVEVPWRLLCVALAVFNAGTRSGERMMAATSPCGSVQMEVHYWAIVVQWALFAVMLYLKRTPRIPPARHQESRVPAGLATEGA